ncbi:hypothetical protein C8F01DRAFT_1173974 [Mycena amicta]|nr:hypothetical protein C8F01DRAFT_1173974 [Mycena amicta]
MFCFSLQTVYSCRCAVVSSVSKNYLTHRHLKVHALTVPTAPVKLYNLGADGSTLFFDDDQSSLWIKRHQPVQNNLIKWSINPAPGSGGYTITNLDAQASFVISQDAGSVDWIVLSNQTTPAVFTFEEVSANDGTFLIKPLDDDDRVLQAFGVSHSTLDFVKVDDILSDNDVHLPFQLWKFV